MKKCLNFFSYILAAAALLLLPGYIAFHYAVAILCCNKAVMNAERRWLWVTFAVIAVLATKPLLLAAALVVVALWVDYNFRKNGL